MKRFYILFIIALSGIINQVSAECISGNCQSGHGIFIYENGSQYDGQWENSKRTGHGIFTWANGAQYTGEFKDDKPDGEGIYIYVNGKMKKVIFRSGKIIKSVWIQKDNFDKDRFYGEFDQLGKYIGWYKGNKYKGYKPHGWGSMCYVNGSKYSGQWNEGRMHGMGSIDWADGSKYIGQWNNGKRTGKGTYIWANGNKYVGEWMDNNMNGNGTFYYNDGKIKKGTWRDSRYIGNSCP